MKIDNQVDTNSTGSGGGQALRVLIVDDAEYCVEPLRVYLSTHGGMEVVGIGHNGEEAVALVENLSPDLVFMDYSMPLMNGLEATEAIKRMKDSPVVLLMSTDPDMVARLAMGDFAPDGVYDKIEICKQLGDILRKFFPDAGGKAKGKGR